MKNLIIKDKHCARMFSPSRELSGPLPFSPGFLSSTFTLIFLVSVQNGANFVKI